VTFSLLENKMTIYEFPIKIIKKGLG